MRGGQTLAGNPDRWARHTRMSDPGEHLPLVAGLPSGVGPLINVDYPLPPRPGLEHHLYLQEGALELTIEGNVHRLSAGDCLRYKLFGASSFRASGHRPARYVLALR